jgi:hypothetical protein
MSHGGWEDSIMSVLSAEESSRPGIEVAVRERERRISSINDQFNRDADSILKDTRSRMASLRARRDEQLIAVWQDYYKRELEYSPPSEVEMIAP